MGRFRSGSLLCIGFCCLVAVQTAQASGLTPEEEEVVQALKDSNLIVSIWSDPAGWAGKTVTKMTAEKLGALPGEDADKIYEWEVVKNVPVVGFYATLSQPLVGADDANYLGGPSVYDAQYAAPSDEQIDRILTTYSMIPGGVELVSQGGFGFPIKSVVYFSRRNSFVVNGSIVYRSPAPPPQTIEILQTAYRERRLAVSTGYTQLFLFGLTTFESTVTKDLFLMDHFLGSLVLGDRPDAGAGHWMNNYRYFGEADLREEPGPKRGSRAVMFSLRNRGFEVVGGRLVGLGTTLQVTVIPLLNGNLRSPAPVASFKPNNRDRRRIDYLVDNYRAIHAEPLLRSADAYAELYDFAAKLAAVAAARQ